MAEYILGLRSLSLRQEDSPLSRPLQTGLSQTSRPASKQAKPGSLCPRAPPRQASLGAQLRVYPSNEVAARMEQWGDHVSRHRASSSSSHCLWEAGLGGLDPERMLSLPLTPCLCDWLSHPILLELS